MLSFLKFALGRKLTHSGVSVGVTVGLMGIAPALPASAAAPAVPTVPAGSRPNIVFILADDLGNADVSFNGGKDIKTPNIDKIAESGAILKQFYAQPVCSPTRAALLTGRYPMRMGLQQSVVKPWATYGLSLSETTLADALHAAGYETAITGKWHLGHLAPEYLPTRRGFEHQYGHYNGALDYFTHLRDGGLDWHRDDKALIETGYSTPLIAQEAVRNIRERDKARPLFLYVPFNAIHGPFQVPPRYKKAYASLPEPRRTLVGMTAALDEAVGTITAELDRQGMRENTLLIFASDNGGPAPGRVSDNGIYRSGKGTVLEGGVRVAACVSWPGRIKPKSVVEQPLHMVDWFPTFLGLAGAKTPGKLPLDGRDAWATIAENKPSPHDAILLNATPTGGAILVGQWKLIVGGSGSNIDEGSAGGSDDPTALGKVPKAGVARVGRPSLELFDLATDPSEKTNLADAQPDRVKEMRAKYDALAKEAIPPLIEAKGADYKAPKVWGEKDVAK